MGTVARPQPSDRPQLARDLHQHPFPDCKRSADVAEQKPDLVFDALEGDDQTAAALWRLLKTAVWRAPTPAAPRTAPDEATIDRIGTTSLGILGIPLVRPDCLEFDLEPPA